MCACLLGCNTLLLIVLVALCYFAYSLTLFVNLLNCYNLCRIVERGCGVLEVFVLCLFVLFLSI